MDERRKFVAESFNLIKNVGTIDITTELIVVTWNDLHGGGASFIRLRSCGSFQSALATLLLEKGERIDMQASRYITGEFIDHSLLRDRLMKMASQYNLRSVRAQFNRIIATSSRGATSTVIITDCLNADDVCARLSKVVGNEGDGMNTPLPRLTNNMVEASPSVPVANVRTILEMGRLYNQMIERLDAAIEDWMIRGVVDGYRIDVSTLIVTLADSEHRSLEIQMDDFINIDYVIDALHSQLKNVRQ